MQLSSDTAERLISPDTEPKTKITSGLWWMLLGSVTMAMMNIGAKVIKLNTTITFMQVNMVRAFIMALGCYLHARWIGIDIHDVPREGRGWVFGRALFGFFSSSL